MTGIRSKVVIAGVASLALAGCGGNGSVTLHGTFTDYAGNPGLRGPNPATCDYELNPNQPSSLALPAAPYRITIAEDNVLAGSVPVHWQDNGNVAPKVSAMYSYTVDVCTGTWSVTLQSPAHTAYEIGIDGVSGTVTVAVADSGETIAINDGTDGTASRVNGGAP